MDKDKALKRMEELIRNLPTPENQIQESLTSLVEDVIRKCMVIVDEC